MGGILNQTAPKKKATITVKKNCDIDNPPNDTVWTALPIERIYHPLF